MRAHTIAHKARVGGRGRTKRTIVPRGILALSLAVVLLAASGGSAAALTGNGVTTPTPPTPPLTLSLYAGLKAEYALYGCDSIPPDEQDTCPRKKLGRTLPFDATTSNDSTLVATGRKIKKTTKQLAAGEETEIKARLKHPKRLNEKPGRGKPKVKIKVAATNEFGQSATDELKVELHRNDRAL